MKEIEVFYMTRAASWVSYMNDSKGQRVFDFLSDTFLIEYGQVKLLSDNKHYQIVLDTMSENRSTLEIIFQVQSNCVRLST